MIIKRFSLAEPENSILKFLRGTRWKIREYLQQDHMTKSKVRQSPLTEFTDDESTTSQCGALIYYANKSDLFL